MGPLTTTWTPPPACSVVVAACSTCTKGWAAQSCPRDSLVTDDPSCWPPRTSGAYTPPTGTPLFAWGIYTPGIVCPQGYSAACSYDGAAQTGDFQFDFSPRETEAATGCCPTYVCPNLLKGLVSSNKNNKTKGLHLRQSGCANVLLGTDFVDQCHSDRDL